MFYWEDVTIYDELWDTFPATAVLKGTPEVVQDVFGFWLKDREEAGEEVTFVYRCRQVLADKVVGTGEAILPGDRVYAIVAQSHAVSATPPAGGVAGTDYYFCGWCKRQADASDARVLINFDGTRYDETI
jgi:hypothetical protein